MSKSPQFFKPIEEPKPLHRCHVCGAQNAPYGYGVVLRQGRFGTWYCNNHRPDALSNDRAGEP